MKLYCHIKWSTTVILLLLRLFTQIFHSIYHNNDCVFMWILELNSKGNGHVCLSFNGWKMFWSRVWHISPSHTCEFLSTCMCVWTHIFPIRAAVRGVHAVTVIMSLSSMCISAAAQHILRHTHASVWSNVNTFVCFLCSSDHDRGTFLPQNA